MKKVLWLLLSLAGIIAVIWWYRTVPVDTLSERSRPPVPVSVFTVRPREFADEVSALGTLRAWESIDISASVAQIITELYFEDGQQVDEGDVLALLKQDAEQATLRELQASLQDARREVRRLENLAKKNQVAQTELDSARTLAEVTGHRIDEVRARIADRTIVAPFSGVLGLRQVSDGALVTPGQRLTTLDDISRMRLEFSLPATQLAFLETGQQVTARSHASGQLFPGVVYAINSRVDPVARSISARAALDNPDGVLRPGLLMEVTLSGAMRRTLLVPEECLQSRASEHFLWKVTGETARRIPVEIGGRIPGWVEIVGGLQAGDQVVRDGVGMLRGDAVTIAVAGD